MLNDFRYALRQLRKNPGFTTVAVLTLALGIGGTTAIFSVLNAVLLRPLPYKNPDQLVMLWRTNTNEGKGQGTASFPDILDWRAQNNAFVHVAAYRADVDWALTAVREPARLRGTTASADLFPLLGVEPFLGRTFLPEEDALGGRELAVLLSYQLWQTHFNGDAAILGKTLTLNQKSFVVVGVMPAGFQFPVRAEPQDLWTTMVTDAEQM